jgi:hypothetical protein
MTTEAQPGAAASEQAPPTSEARQKTDRAGKPSPKLETDGPVASHDDEIGDGTADAEDRGHDERIVAKSIQTSNAVIDSQLSIAGDLNIGATERETVPVADVTGSIEAAEKTYVEPEYHQCLSDALIEPKVIVLVGAACGKRTTAQVALRQKKHNPILQLPSDMAIRRLVGGIEKVGAKSPSSGIVVEAIDPKTLVALTNFEVHRLAELLTKGVRVVLTATSLHGVPQQLDGVTIIHCSVPSPSGVIRRAGRDADATQRAIEAIELLEGRCWSPSDALALLDCAGDATQSPEDLARAFDGNAACVVLDEWLSTDRSAKHVACLVAAATLDGEPSVDVDAAAATLAEAFAADQEELSEGTKTFRVADRGWPEGLVEITHTPTGTHFGYHEVEAIRVCPPHSRSQIIKYLWHRLGADFRRPFTEWLKGLAAHPNPRIRTGAAVTAGILFTIDPVIAERDLMKPWGLDKRFSSRLCAAIALGTPIATDADPAGARALAQVWSTSSSLQLRHVAVLAYGGLLGAWDPASAAPAHLWRIATESPELTRSANVSIASLMTAGASAARIRASVLGMLAAQAAIDRVPSRVYILLPLIIRHLTAGGELSSDSLKALVSQPEEAATLTTLGTLLANTFIAPPGYDHAKRALDSLLHGVADGHIEQGAALAILAAMRDAARRVDKLNALDARLRRALSTTAREHDESADAARAVLEAIFPANQGDTLGASRRFLANH